MCYAKETPRCQARNASSPISRWEGEPTARSEIERAAPNTVAETRYGLLEPLREYALERFGESPHAQSVRQRHARYFTALAETAA